ncbi:MAG TPA: toxic anion resistance protein [Actinomycetota bacterium]
MSTPEPPAGNGALTPPEAAAQTQALTPPAQAGTTLVLQPPQAVQAVAPEQAPGMIQMDPAVATKLDAMADGFVQSVIQMDPKSVEFQQKSDAVRAIGDKEVRESAEVSNRLLDKPVRAMGSGLFDNEAPVAKSLVDLRQTIEDLDPGKQGIMSKKKLFGLIPFGDHMRDYFDKYHSAQNHIEAILQALYSGQDELRQDNASVEQEKANLWQAMQRLNQYVYLAKRLDAGLEMQINVVESTEAEKGKAMREDLLFPVRQKVQDLLTQLAVSAQGYLALDLIRKNNVELIKGVDRATTTTVSALRTAVIVAQALANQKLVLDQISALNETTGNVIEGTSEMLREQSAEVGKQAASSAIEVSKLQAAFNNIYATMDAIDGFKLQALDSMKQTVQTLEQEVGKAQDYLNRVRQGEQRDQAPAAPAELSLPDLS